MTMKYEAKIIGINPIWITILLTGAFLIICSAGGNNVDWGYLGFEVIFPFYLSIAIAEWCQTRTDMMFEIVSLYERSVFTWIIRRFLLLFGMISIFLCFGIIGITFMKPNISIIGLLAAFLPTAFFLSSVCVFISLLSDIPHISAMIVGVLWLFSIMTMSLLRFTAVQYFYLFVRYAGINNDIWVKNKLILLSIGLSLWFGIYLFCKKRIWSYQK